MDVNEVFVNHCCQIHVAVYKRKVHAPTRAAKGKGHATTIPAEGV